MALKNYFGRRDAFKLFMASGEATHTKSFEAGYKAFLFWNLTKNSPVIRMDGVTYIPEKLIDKYTYDNHVNFLMTLMSKDGVNVQKVSDYTREKLILAYANKRVVPPLNISYNLKNGWFTIKSVFEMMADPDTGDVILKLQNENITDVEAYKELHRQGFAISVEVWNGQKFVGGLYGVTIGLSFFGESMCSLEPNASKLALIHLAQTMQKTGGQLIDCQFHTPHLESMGGRHIDYGEYMRIISSCNTSAPQASNPESA
jgi:leucyl/phenylalanyl-tRNA--protein transferase